MPPPLKICFAASEVAPFIKTGGLADVASSLPRHLHRRGQDVRVFTPLYSSSRREGRTFHPVSFLQNVTLQLGARAYTFRLQTATLPGTDLAVYFVDCPELYDRGGPYTEDADEPQRFALFSAAVIESCQRMGWAPDVFHCNDWHTALIPLQLRTVYDWDALFRESKTLLTIHNIGYQGSFAGPALEAVGLSPWAARLSAEDRAAPGRINFLRTGILHADVVGTVSPTYAREIQTDELGMGLQALLRARRGTLVGILNGVDYDEWSPERDPHIPYPFSLGDPRGKRENKLFLLGELGLSGGGDAPLVGIVSRLVQQKGFDLCFEVLPEALGRAGARLAVLGSGERRYEEFFSHLERAFPGRACFYRGYSNELAHLIEAGADMLLMPSRYEPCGLNQMFSLRYGTIPVVRKTGGLADSVQLFDDRRFEGTGFVFEHFTPEGLRWALGYALRTYRNPVAWRRLMRNAMAQDFSWETQAQRYLELYAWLARG